MHYSIYHATLKYFIRDLNSLFRYSTVSKGTFSVHFEFGRDGTKCTT